MNEGMKQRLVGALVLVALATVVLPIVFDFDGSYQVDTRSLIPPAPDIQRLDIAKAGPQQGSTETAAQNQMFRFDESRARAEQGGGEAGVSQNQGLGLDAEGIPRAWILQVASFSDLARARALTEQLLDDDYKAYSRSAVVQGQTIYRIYVGPKMSKQSLQKKQRLIEQKYQLQGLLLKFSP
ncbi:hypothetical protein A9Q89_06885 [Gammaproteobacteria bacterium 53_120_T64]|nr:hypothetical protein A9Q89_06885 [Gammaproteobacteria bacterium 53_120_T64]